MAIQEGTRSVSNPPMSHPAEERIVLALQRFSEGNTESARRVLEFYKPEHPDDRALLGHVAWWVSGLVESSVEDSLSLTRDHVAAVQRARARIGL